MSGEPWSKSAREVLDEIYRFWAAEGRPPNLADLHDRCGRDRRVLVQDFAELEAGFALACNLGRLQLNIIKCPPYSAVPTPVRCERNGAFHTFVGCAAEAFAIANLPMYEGEVLGIRSYCACCYAPISVSVRGLEVVSTAPAEPHVALSASPWEWGPHVACDLVCDSIHFVLDRDHAERFDRQIGRRSVVCTLEQMRQLASHIAGRRMRDPEWGPSEHSPTSFIPRLTALGIDTSPWD